MVAVSRDGVCYVLVYRCVHSAIYTCLSIQSNRKHWITERTVQELDWSKSKVDQTKLACDKLLGTWHSRKTLTCIRQDIWGMPLQEDNNINPRIADSQLNRHWLHHPTPRHSATPPLATVSHQGFCCSKSHRERHKRPFLPDVGTSPQRKWKTGEIMQLTCPRKQGCLLLVSCWTWKKKSLNRYSCSIFFSDFYSVSVCLCLSVSLNVFLFFFNSSNSKVQIVKAAPSYGPVCIDWVHVYWRILYCARGRYLIKVL